MKWLIGLISLIGLIRPIAAEPQPRDLFFTQLRAEMQQVSRKRAGLVLWLDRETKQLEIFGDLSLLNKKFLPGSVMKLITAEAALPKLQVFSYHCTGHDRIGGKKLHCWTHQGHGFLDLPKALGVSCNLFFAKLGSALGAAGSLENTFSDFAFSANSTMRTEKFSDLDWAKFAIGDHNIFQVTPKEMLDFWDGYLKKLSNPRFAPIQQGLSRAVNEGTAARSVPPGMKILGKTGTGDSLNSHYKTNGWFLGTYPVEQPRFALVIFLQEAYGFREASELAEKIFSWAKKYGVLETN